MQNKRVLITGGAGFIANAILREYLPNNRVVVLDNFLRDTLTGSGLANHPNLSVIKGSVLDPYSIMKGALMSDVVIHCAAIAGIDSVIQKPVETMMVNMIGTANVLQELVRRNMDLDRFVDFSTSEVFGPMAVNSMESDQTVSGSAGEARWTYAVSKLAGEHLTHAYHRQYGLPTVTVRPFNIYGPGQTGEGAIQVFVRKALNGETIHIDGDGTQIRAWCYIDDFIDGLLRCIEDPKAIGESFNIGNSRAVMTILGLAQTVCRVLKSDSKIVHDQPLSADVAIRIPSVKKAREVLGFEAKIDLEEGILKTAEYYKGLI